MTRMRSLSAAVLFAVAAPHAHAGPVWRILRPAGPAVVVPAPTRPLVFPPGNSIPGPRGPLMPGGRFGFNAGRGLFLPQAQSIALPQGGLTLALGGDAASREASPEELSAFAGRGLEDAVRLFARDPGQAPGRMLPPPPSPYSDAEIVAMAKGLAQTYKGAPWSYTEYHSVLYPTLDSLRQQGVPERQIQLFQNTCDEFPGRPFNPWSGD